MSGRPGGFLRGYTFPRRQERDMTKQEYQFGVNDEAESFCDQIVGRVVQLFGITEDEAVGRMNRQWRGLDFEKEDLRYHQLPDDWAGDLYYGADSYWWMKPAGLHAKPYP